MATQTSDSIRQRARATTGDELAVVVQRAQSFTNSSGAAIAIGEGNKDEIVCRARSGASAPDVGAVLRVEGTFTGICIQTGKELRCDDAETDTRVDTAAIRALGIRSMVVTPIKDEGKVVGVLAVFAPTPHAFTITHVAVLKTMADQIAALLQKERRTKDEPQVAAPAPVAKIAPKPAPLPAPVVIKPAPTQSTLTGAAAAPARAAAPAPVTVEPLRPVPIASDIAPPKKEKREHKRSDHRFEPASASKTSLATFDAVGGEPKKHKNVLLIGIVGAIVLAGGATWAFVKMHKSGGGTTTAASTQQPQQLQNSQNTPSPVQPVITPSPTAAVSSPATVPVPVPPIITPQPTKTAAVEKPQTKKNAQPKNQPGSKPSPAPATPVTVALSGGPSKLTSNSQEQTPEVAPSLAVGGSNSVELTSVVRPVGGSTPSMIAQSDLVNARAIKAVPAIYPPIAKARRISGTEVVRVTVGKDGKVSNIRYISGPVIFKDAAVEAVKQWVFQPATLNGQPIEQETEVRVTFRGPN